MFRHALGDGIELLLRGPHHAEECFALIDANREHLGRWLPWVKHTRSAEDVGAHITRVAKMYGERGDVVAAICVDGRMAGIVGLEDVDAKAGSAEIGYWLGKEYEGRGLVTKACRALLNYAFVELSLNRVQIQVAPENQRSKAVPLRLGFTYEGTLRQVDRTDDGFEDSEVYSVLRDEWAG